MVCKYELYQGALYLAFAVLWMGFTIWWILNTWIKNKFHTKSLQKLILFVLLFKTFYSGFYSGSKLLCDTSEDEAYWGLATTSTFTLYNTFVYTVLALISRGFCLLRESLSRGEVSSIAIVMGFVYLGFSAYLIQPDDLAPVLLVIIGILFFSSTKCCIRNIKILQIRFFNLQQANIRPILPEIAQKISMLKTFLLFSYVFYMNEVLSYTLICIGQTINLDSNNDFWGYIRTIEEVLVTVSVFAICVTFRSKARPSNLNHSLIEDLAPQPIAPILFARLPNSDTNPSDEPCISLCPPQHPNGKT